MARFCLASQGFNPTVAVAAEAVRHLRVRSLACPAALLLFVANGAFRGARDTKCALHLCFSLQPHLQHPRTAALRLPVVDAVRQNRASVEAAQSGVVHILWCCTERDVLLANAGRPWRQVSRRIL